MRSFRYRELPLILIIPYLSKFKRNLKNLLVTFFFSTKRLVLDKEAFRLSYLKLRKK